MKLFKKSLTILSLLTACCVLAALDYPQSYSEKVLKSITGDPATTNDVVPGASNILFQSSDGGQTWQDISQSLPENELPEGFFAGESDIYVRVGSAMYRSKSNLKTPVWEKENIPDPQSVIAFNRSGVLAFNREGQIYQRMPPAGNWAPTYTNLKKNAQIIFETSDGTVLVGSEGLLYKSTDKGQSWKQVQNAGLVMEIVESEGVLVGTGKRGIIRSTDNGENWQLVIGTEGSFGIAIDRIEGGLAAIEYNTKSNTRRIHFSFDNGKTWKAVDEALPPSLSISSITQVGKYLICGHRDGIYRSSDVGKTWNRVHSGVKEPAFGASWTISPNKSDNKTVFNIYVSGNIVYAVAEKAGC